jgi:luciferase family oxidoreductase group 1
MAAALAKSRCHTPAFFFRLLSELGASTRLIFDIVERSSRMKLSALDLFSVEEGVPPSRVIHESVKVAQHAEKLGFLRYWVAEHHNMPAIASAAPEVLIAHLAAHTKTLRIGAGGIMLPNHTPLHVLEVFRTLEAIYPGRIDLGIGRAPGTDPVTSSALSRNQQVNQQIAELHAFIHGGFPADHPYSRIVAMPNDVACPPVWMLGSTDAGAAIAAQLGLPYAFAGHFSMEHAPAAMARYHREFTPGAIDKPYAILAVSVVCAETDEEAERLAMPIRVAFAMIRRGQVRALYSVEKAIALGLSAEDRAVTSSMIVGGPTKVREGLSRLMQELRPDEIMLSTHVANPELRMRSYSLVS